MTEISAALVKELRERTGAGMMDCKKALQETGGSIDKALDVLREKGLAAAAKKSGRIAAEGIVYAYIHGGGRVGVLVEMNCETDFVAKTSDFRELTHEVALQIAAMKPLFVRAEEIPAETIQHEREIERERARQEGKPENRLDAIVEGRIKKYFETTVLLEQPYIRDDKKKVSDLLKEAVARTGENVSVRRFVRWEVGEGIEKRSDDFAGEIAKLTGGGC